MVSVRFTVFVFLLISCIATASSLEQEEETRTVDDICGKYKDALAKLILKFLEKLRPQMSTGIPSLGIPPLDPLQLPETNFSVSKPYQFDLNGQISKSSLQGLQAFNVTGISTSFLKLQANVSVAIPYLDLRGLYRMKGKLVAVIPVNGAGPYKLSPMDVTTFVRTKLKIVKSRLQITDMNFSLDMERMYVNFDGLYGGGTIGKWINAILNKFGLRLFHKIEPLVHDKLRVALITEINNKLKDIPLTEFMDPFSPACKMAIVRDIIG